MKRIVRGVPALIRHIRVIRGYAACGITAVKTPMSEAAPTFANHEPAEGGQATELARQRRDTDAQRIPRRKLRLLSPISVSLWLIS